MFQAEVEEKIIVKEEDDKQERKASTREKCNG